MPNSNLYLKHFVTSRNAVNGSRKLYERLREIFVILFNKNTFQLLISKEKLTIFRLNAPGNEIKKPSLNKKIFKFFGPMIKKTFAVLVLFIF